MYREIIVFKRDTPVNVLTNLKKICSAAHDNIAGKIDIKMLSDKHFIFEGTEDCYSCLQLGYLELDENLLFRKYIYSWQWEDEEPGESCDLLKELS